MAQGRSTQTIATIKWIRTSRLSIKNSLSEEEEDHRLSRRSVPTRARLEVEQLRENLADSMRNIFRNLYQNRLDGPIACHVLIQNSRFLKISLVEIGQVFTQPLYKDFRISRLQAFRIHDS